MNQQTAKQILDKIEVGHVREPKLDLNRAAEKYTFYRTAWGQVTPQERHLIDPPLTRSHNALIDAFNILSREQAKRGEDNSCRAALGEDRKKLVDTAANIVMFLALSTR